MRRVLLVTPYFHPNPHIGGIRATSFARYLPTSGWGCVVVATMPGGEGQEVTIDLGGTAVPALTLPGKPLAPPRGTLTGLVAAGRAVAANIGATVSIPDNSRRMWSRYRHLIEGLARRYDVAAVVTTSPPHAIHMVGRRIRERLGVPWVADLRDPMLGDHRYDARGLQRLRKHAFRAYEAGLTCDPDRVVVTNERHLRDLCDRYPGQHFELLPNGYPGELFEQQIHASRDGAKRVVLVANLEDAELRLVVDAFDRVMGRHDVELHLVGWPAPSIAEAEARLGARLVSHGHIAHADSIALIQGADVLLTANSLERQAGRGLSSKLYEFMATGKAIVDVNPLATDRELLARWYPTASVLLDAPTPDELAAPLDQALGSRLAPLHTEVEAVRNAFDRRAVAGRLASMLDSLDNIRRALH